MSGPDLTEAPTAVVRGGTDLSTGHPPGCRANGLRRSPYLAARATATRPTIVSRGQPPRRAGVPTTTAPTTKWCSVVSWALRQVESIWRECALLCRGLGKGGYFTTASKP